MAVITPHFDLPFRIQGSTVPVVEQDSYEDIANCAEVIIRTPLGFRNDLLEFGFPDLLFQNIPIVNDDVVAIVSGQEPRSILLFIEQPDLVDALVDNIIVGVG